MATLNFIPHDDTEVYSIDGHLIGKVLDAHAAQYTSSRSLARLVGEVGSAYFQMEPLGLRGVDTLYVPLDAMSDYTDERVRLRFTRKQIGKLGWDQPPTADTRPQRM